MNLGARPAPLALLALARASGCRENPASQDDVHVDTGGGSSSGGSGGADNGGAGTTGASVTLDGSAVPAGTPVGDSGYSIIHMPLDSSGTGNHVVDATDRVGISVYGYGRYTSYWYPGGLDLTQF